MRNMMNCGGCDDEQNWQTSFDDEYCLFLDHYENTVWNANPQQIGHDPNQDSSEIFNSSWMNEGSQAAGTVESLTAQGFFQTASGILSQENQTAAGIQTLTQELLGPPANISTHSRNNIHETSEAQQKWRERKRGYDKAYRERLKQKRQKLEVENQEKDEQMKAYEAEIGRLKAENKGYEQLMKSNLAEFKGKNESLKEENLLLNQRLQTQSRALDQLRNKLKYRKLLNTKHMQKQMMLKKRLERLAKEMEDMRAQTAAMGIAVEERRNELQSLISEMLMRVKEEYAFLDALFTEIPNYEPFATQAIPHEDGLESTNLIQTLWDS